MCDFPARELLAKRRAAATNKDIPIAEAYAVIKDIDDQRWKHLEQTRCNCWQLARESACKLEKQVTDAGASA